jgi:hypothetical protein
MPSSMPARSRGRTARGIRPAPSANSTTRSSRGIHLARDRERAVRRGTYRDATERRGRGGESSPPLHAKRQGDARGVTTAAHSEERKDAALLNCHGIAVAGSNPVAPTCFLGKLTVVFDGELFTWNHAVPQVFKLRTRTARGFCRLCRKALPWQVFSPFKRDSLVVLRNPSAKISPFSELLR